MITIVLMSILVVIPVLAIVMEWVVTPGISERHYGDHDVFVVSQKLSQVPAGIAVAAGVPGVVLGLLRIIDMFEMRAAPFLSFFAAFVLVAFVMWVALRRYRVTTYDDRLSVRPFVGPSRTVRYDEIDRLVWSDVRILTNTSDLSIVVGGRIAAVLVGTVDIDQILLRVDRDDAIVWAR